VNRSAIDEDAVGATHEIDPMAVPFRQTPTRFRWWWTACLVGMVASIAAVLVVVPGPSAIEIARQPGAVLLLILVLLAEIYPALPWMRKSSPFQDYVLSTPLVIAALLAFGPHAAWFFLVAGAAMTLPYGMVWWRVVLNVSLWGLQGAAAACVLALLEQGFGMVGDIRSAALVPVAVVLAVVVESLNVLFVMTSQVLAGATTRREYFADWRSQLAIGTLALTAPIPAVLAAEQPAMLPFLALSMVAAQVGIRAVSSRTLLAGTDPLTSMANRDRLLARLQDRLIRLRPPRETVTLLLVDLDRFKSVNDDFGHLAGDMVLVEVARRLQDSTRSDDLVARFGGDEFVILLSGGVPLRSIDDVIGRIRRAVGRPIPLPAGSVTVGVSVGAATATERGVDPLELVRLADSALYEAKSLRPPAVSPPAVSVSTVTGPSVSIEADWTAGNWLPSWSVTRTSRTSAPVNGHAFGLSSTPSQ
jgi:diguanylate cyclase (GGDEF)-like protein